MFQPCLGPSLGNGLASWRTLVSPALSRHSVDWSASVAGSVSRTREYRRYALASSSEMSLTALSTVVPRRFACVRLHGRPAKEMLWMRTEDWRAAGGCGGRSISVQHPQRVPLGGLPAIWCSGALSRPCQLIPEGV